MFQRKKTRESEPWREEEKRSSPARRRRKKGYDTGAQREATSVAAIRAEVVEL